MVCLIPCNRSICLFFLTSERKVTLNIWRWCSCSRTFKGYRLFGWFCDFIHDWYVDDWGILTWICWKVWKFLTWFYWFIFIWFRRIVWIWQVWFVAWHIWHNWSTWLGWICRIIRILHFWSIWEFRIIRFRNQTSKWFVDNMFCHFWLIWSYNFRSSFCLI